jgi:hypothetical protein
MKYAILYADSRYQSGWGIITGHDCYTKNEMDQYCKTLDPDGKIFRVVKLPFNVENPNPAIGKPIAKEPTPNPKLTGIAPETAAIMIELWDDLRKKGV